jgi:branched-chain amino acid transport system ATP-binding protein
MRFGGVTALNAVNIDLYPGEILALIGPNGAGKTTVFNVVTGVYQATEGDIVFNGERLNGMNVLTSPRRASLVLSRTC